MMNFLSYLSSLFSLLLLSFAHTSVSLSHTTWISEKWDVRAEFEQNSIRDMKLCHKKDHSDTNTQADRHNLRSTPGKDSPVAMCCCLALAFRRLSLITWLLTRRSRCFCSRRSFCCADVRKISISFCKILIFSRISEARCAHCEQETERNEVAGLFYSFLFGAFNCSWSFNKVPTAVNFVNTKWWRWERWEHFFSCLEQFLFISNSHRISTLLVILLYSWQKSIIHSMYLLDEIDAFVSFVLDNIVELSEVPQSNLRLTEWIKENYDIKRK